MTPWTSDELTRIGGAEEVQLASVRPDGTLRPYVTMWVVRAGDDLYVRSAYGPDNPWYRRAKASGAGRVRAGALERDAAFAEAAPGARCHRRRLPLEVRPVRRQHHQPANASRDAQAHAALLKGETARPRHGAPSVIFLSELLLFCCLF